MSQPQTSPANEVDLSNCDREPIHIPGSVQGHGCLLVLSAGDAGDLVIQQASENCSEFFAMPLERILGGQCDEVLGTELERDLRNELRLKRGTQSNRFLRSARLASGADVEIITHSVKGMLIAEFERVESKVEQNLLNTTIINVVAQLEVLNNIPDLARATTREFSALTGFDRILLYSFDEQGTGTVIAEECKGSLPSMLYLRFPATDIPQQARQLYVQNRVRIIPDVDYTPSTIVSRDAEGEPLDLTHSVLRSVSPVHREYMRNMGTASSMSFSLVIDGKLWGMISCHNATAKTVPYVVRSGCDVLARIVAAQISAHTRGADYSEAIRLKAIERDLLTYMALEEKYIDGITNHPEKVLALVNATGAAFILDDTCVLMGETPSESQVKLISDWVAKQPDHEFIATDHLASLFPLAQAFADTASGLLSISLSQVHKFQILWFRPEVLRTVHWAGEPDSETKRSGGTVQINPRNSFAAWSETVRQRSASWTRVELEAVQDFRNAVLLIVLRRAEELAEMTAELEFTNKELEAFSYSVSHDLRAPFRHISGFAELLMSDEAERLSDRGKQYLSRIGQSAKFAGELVDSLLNFSQIARTRLDMRPISMASLVKEVWDDVISQELQGRHVEMHLGELPTVEGDLNLLRQVWRNLLSNAAKYTRMRNEARVDVKAHREHAHYVFSVCDNGVGFDNRYVHKLFGAFQRLHRVEEFEGTGIGLANVRRIVGRHGGNTWAEGRLNEGACFYFSFPVPEPHRGPNEDPK